VVASASGPGVSAARSYISGGMPMLLSQRSLSINHCRASQPAASARLPGARGPSRTAFAAKPLSNVVHMWFMMYLDVLDIAFQLRKHWCAILAPLCVKWAVFAGL
jgi:hypothetical protein